MDTCGPLTQCPAATAARLASAQILLYYLPTRPSERPATLQRSRDLYYQFCDEMVCTTPADDGGATDHVRGALGWPPDPPHGTWRLKPSFCRRCRHCHRSR